MTRLSIAEARRLGLIPGKKKPSRVPKPNPVSWDAKKDNKGIWLQLPTVPPSLNVWKNWHWAKQHEYKEQMKQDIKILALGFKLPKFEKATVSITYYFRTNRRRDKYDNFAPKFLADALVAADILTDDNSELVDFITELAVDKGKPRTEIFIQEGKDESSL